MPILNKEISKINYLNLHFKILRGGGILKSRKMKIIIIIVLVEINEIEN